jgi:hypothetical protein
MGEGKLSSASCAGSDAYIRRGYSHASSKASINSARRVLHSIFVSGCLLEVRR